MPARKLYARAVWRGRPGAPLGWVLNVENADGHEIIEGSRPQNIDKSFEEVASESFDEETEYILRYNLRNEPVNFEPLHIRGWNVTIRNGVHDANNPVTNHFHLEQRCIYNPNGGQQICEFGKSSTVGGEYYICNLAIYHNPIERY